MKLRRSVQMNTSVHLSLTSNYSNPKQKPPALSRHLSMADFGDSCLCFLNYFRFRPKKPKQPKKMYKPGARQPSRPNRPSQPSFQRSFGSPFMM